MYAHILVQLFYLPITFTTGYNNPYNVKQFSLCLCMDACILDSFYIYLDTVFQTIIEIMCYVVASLIFKNTFFLPVPVTVDFIIYIG